MLGYKIYVAKWIAREIRDRETRTDTVLAFPYLVTQIFLEARVPELPDIDQFLWLRTKTDLRLIRDITNPI